MTTAHFEDQFAAGAVLEYALHLLQRWSKTPWITEHTAGITVAFRALLACCATIGLSWQYHGGTLIITGLTPAIIGAGIWHLLQQYAVQHGFGKLIRNGNLDAFRKIVVDVLREQLAEGAGSVPQTPAVKP